MHCYRQFQMERNEMDSSAPHLFNDRKTKEIYNEYTHKH